MLKGTKKLTNVELVTKMMEFSNFGALSQLFIIEAIGQFADKVSKLSPKDIPNNCFISPEAWIGVAKEIKEQIDNR